MPAGRTRNPRGDHSRLNSLPKGTYARRIYSSKGTRPAATDTPARTAERLRAEPGDGTGHLLSLRMRKRTRVLPIAPTKAARRSSQCPPAELIRAHIAPREHSASQICRTAAAAGGPTARAGPPGHDEPARAWLRMRLWSSANCRRRSRTQVLRCRCSGRRRSTRPRHLLPCWLQSARWCCRSLR